MGEDARSARWRAPRGLEIELVLAFPAPDFCLGSADTTAPLQERPQHPRPLPREFWIGRYPVTWAQYEAFCAAEQRRAPDRPPWAGPDHPVVSVSWADAEAFCAWAGLALPTEAEWEHAARGARGGSYPWGDRAPRAETCVWVGHPMYGRRATAPVTVCPAGAADCGALHMAGNVWEWCHYAGSYATQWRWPLRGWWPFERWFPLDGHVTLPRGGYVRRGGSFRESARACRVTSRALSPPHCLLDCGFRPVLRSSHLHGSS